MNTNHTIVTPSKEVEGAILGLSEELNIGFDQIWYRWFKFSDYERIYIDIDVDKTDVANAKFASMFAKAVLTETDVNYEVISCHKSETGEFYFVIDVKEINEG